MLFVGVGYTILYKEHGNAELFRIANIRFLWTPRTLMNFTTLKTFMTHTPLFTTHTTLMKLKTLTTFEKLTTLMTLTTLTTLTTLRRLTKLTTLMTLMTLMALPAPICSCTAVRGKSS